MRGMSYRELAFAVLSRFADDIPAADLKLLVDRTYTKETFGSDDVHAGEEARGEPSTSSGSRTAPSLAFKDIALQAPRQPVRVRTGKHGEQVNILGATSGDTGPSAEYALRGKKNIRVFMLSPHGRMSPFPGRADVFAAGCEHLQHRGPRRVRRLPGHRQEHSGDAAFKRSTASAR